MSFDVEDAALTIVREMRGHARRIWTWTSIERECRFWTRVSLRLGRDSRCITLSL